ncbi:MAG TPA: redoxin domain-containing protein, partial [Anaerolineae bacterium]|nr:redoxin domain-containing protein [Anaerolineae bacterium]
MQRAILLLLLILSLTLAACGGVAAPLPDLSGTEPAPDIALPTPDGDMLSLSDFRGQVIFLNFWGTYCPPCVAE